VTQPAPAMKSYVKIVPWTSASAKRLGLVSLDEMSAALATAVESPAAGMKIVDVPAIRAMAKAFA